MSPNGATGASVVGLLRAARDGYGDHRQDLDNAIREVERIALDMRAWIEYVEDTVRSFDIEPPAPGKEPTHLRYTRKWADELWGGK